MAVNIHGKGGSGMAQVCLDVFDIIAGLQRIDGKAMSQIVKTIVRQFRPLQDLFVMLDDCPFLTNSVVNTRLWGLLHFSPSTER